MTKNFLIAPLLAVALIAPTAAFAHEGEVEAEGDLGHDVIIPSLGERLKHRLQFGIDDRLHGGADDAVEVNALNAVRVKQELHASTSIGDDRGHDGRRDKVEAHAGSAIDARIDSLTKLSNRIANSKLLDAATISSIRASISAEIQALTSLKAKIGSDTSTTTFKDDVKSITQGVRVYLLVEPKARIAAAAGRITAVATQFEQLSVKLDARIDAAADAGASVTAARAALADLNAKVADAKAQADAAVSLTADLSADNGDKAKLQANIAALKTARQKLAAAEADLRAARKDAWEIMKSVKGASVTASTTTSVKAR